MAADNGETAHIRIAVSSDYESAGIVRLDKVLAAELPELSRTYVQRLIDEASVLVDEKPAKRSQKVRAGQVILLDLPEPRLPDLEPEDVPVNILYEDEDVLVVDKPAGMVVHPAPGHETGTLVNALLGYLTDISISGNRRPGIVHRLDKDTSGVLVVAKTDAGQSCLLEQWREREVAKHYLCLVHGQVEPDEGTIDAPIGRDPANRLRMKVREGGKPALTHFRVLHRFAGATLVEAFPETGRTHQIRVHFSFIGHSIVGDRVYRGLIAGGFEVHICRQFLHAELLSFKSVGNLTVRVWSGLPPDLRECLQSVVSFPG